MAPTLRLFGHPILERDGTVTGITAPPKAIALLALLVVAAGRAVTRESLARALWRDDEPEKARANLRRHVHQLREALGADLLVVSRDAMQWNTLSGVVVDALAFEARIEREPEPAVELYRGDFCEGVDEEVLDAHRVRYRGLYERALDALISQAQRGEHHADAVRWAKRALALDPFNERHVRLLMRTHERLGDPQSALSEYRALSSRLQAELDASPEPETRALFERLLRAADSQSPPHNLPPQATSFVGREDELAELARMAQARSVISITGAGGIGKTRLACRFAMNTASNYASGRWFVPVEPRDTVAALWRRLATAANINTPGEPRAHVLREFTTGARLVIFDGCEHALDAAREIVETLRARTQAHVIAATRRRLSLEGEGIIELLPLQAPQQARADEIQSLLRYPAFRLFVERAASANPSFRAAADTGAVVALLGKIDALPLAIELIAARLRHFSARTLLEHYGTSGVPMKLEQTVASSYAALGEDERRLFCALSVFQGSFSLDAAESVYGEPVERLLSELVDASLVQLVRAQSPARYRLLDVLRHFAAERLKNEAALRERHARYYAQLARSYQPHFRSPREIEYFRLADADAENFTVALRWGAENDAALAAGLARALAHYFTFRWDFAALEEVLDRLGADSALALGASQRGALLLARGLVAKAKVDNDRAIAHLREAREIFRRDGNAPEEIEALFALSIVAFNRGLAQDALALFEEVLVMQQAERDEYGSAQTMLNLAATLDVLGFAERAHDLQMQALAKFRSLHFPRGIAYAYRGMAVTCSHLHKLDEAIEAAQASVAIFETLDDTRWLADALTMLANQLAEAGRCEQAVQPLRRALQLLIAAPDPRTARSTCLSMFEIAAGLGLPSQAASALGKAESLGREHGLVTAPYYDEYLRPILDRVRAQLGEDRFDALCAQGGSMGIEDLLRALDTALADLR